MNSPTTPSCPEPSQSDDSRTGETLSPPAQEPSLFPTLLTFPCVGAVKFWPLTQDVVDALASAFPSLDVLAEARIALAWVEASPDRKKTARGMRRFLVSWLARTQDRGSRRAAGPAAPRETVADKLRRIQAREGQR